MIRSSFMAIQKKLTHFNIRQVRNMSLLVDKAYVDGSWVNATGAGTFEVKNPATGEVIGSVPDMDAKDAQQAICAAKRAYTSGIWSEITAKQRSDLMRKWFNLIECHTEEIAEIMTAESGKPINESKGEIAYGNGFLEWYAEEARRIYGDIVPSPRPNREVIVMKQPLGVAALITPWNFPMAMITRKAAAALAAGILHNRIDEESDSLVKLFPGCTVIVKPAEDTPLTALALAKLADEAGIPKGVINVITAKKGAQVGDILCKSPDIDGISFTGSTEVGKLLYRLAAEGVKRISLELGGNAPFIVFDSANLEKAVEGAMASKFRNCGQTCVSANRFLVQEGIYDSFVDAMKQRVESLKIGDGSCADVQIGPLINKMQFDKVSAYVDDARSKGAKVITGGEARTDLGPFFYAPTVITNVTPDAKVYTEEVFGPVVSIVKVKDEQEALLMANDTRRGLAGYFFSEDLQQVFRVAKKLEVGMVGVNEGLFSAAEAPFGGVKESGIGREGGRYGIDEYVELKYICVGNLNYN